MLLHISSCLLLLLVVGGGLDHGSRHDFSSFLTAAASADARTSIMDNEVRIATGGETANGGAAHEDDVSRSGSRTCDAAMNGDCPASSAVDDTMTATTTTTSTTTGDGGVAHHAGTVNGSSSTTTSSNDNSAGTTADEVVDDEEEDEYDDEEYYEGEYEEEDDYNEENYEEYEDYYEEAAGNTVADDDEDLLVAERSTVIPPYPVVGDDDHVIVPYGEKQAVLGNDENRAKTMAIIEEMHRYMYTNVLLANAPLKTTKEVCILKDSSCSFWASIGECDVNPNYMKTSCAPACHTCEQVHFDTRCPMPDDMSSTDIFQPGQLHNMFERIISESDTMEYNTTVISRAGDKHDKVGTTPWIIVLDDFLTDEECETLIRLGGERGYEQSRDVGAKLADGSYDAAESSGRTSTNAWCQEECYNHTITQTVLSKIENLTGIPDMNSEYLQLLKYEVGQFYESHHDYIDHHKFRRQGPRILTLFLYLNDVIDGGGTRFTDLDITISPKRGKAVLWPSVKNENLNRKDHRTHHEALPVLSGIKYGANAWLHLRDFKTPFKENCI